MPVNPLLLVRVVAAIALFAAGWLVNGWRWESRWSEREAGYAAAVVEASEEAREREQVLADAIARVDAEHTAERTKADEEISRLRAAVDAGAVRLRVAARCPTASVSQAAAGSGVDHGTGAELAADARQDYFALRAGLTRQEQKLAACQATLAGERR